VASQYKSNKEEFDKTAREWTKKHANPNIKEEKIARLMEMGFSRNACEVFWILYLDCFEQKWMGRKYST